MNRNTPLKRTRIRRTATLARISANQRRRKARYDAARARVVERDQGMCQRHLAERSMYVTATDCHHKQGRTGERMWDESMLVMLCADCHRWATENPAEAFATGWSVRRVT